MADTVREIMRGIRTEGITEFDHPRYHNIEQMKINESEGVLRWASFSPRVEVAAGANGGH